MVLASLLSRESSYIHAATWVSTHVNGASPFKVSPSFLLVYGWFFGHPWLKFLFRVVFSLTWVFSSLILFPILFWEEVHGDPSSSSTTILEHTPSPLPLF